MLANRCRYCEVDDTENIYLSTLSQDNMPRMVQIYIEDDMMIVDTIGCGELYLMLDIEYCPKCGRNLSNSDSQEPVTEE